MLSLQSFLRKGVSLSQVGSIFILKDLKELLSLQSFLRKGVSLGHVGRKFKPKGPKELPPAT